MSINEVSEGTIGKAYLENVEFMKIEPSAPYPQAQNNGAERSGGAIKTEIRAMAIGANISEELMEGYRRRDGSSPNPGGYCFNKRTNT
jgi:hypothetical protein